MQQSTLLSREEPVSVHDIFVIEIIVSVCESWHEVLHEKHIANLASVVTKNKPPLWASMPLPYYIPEPAQKTWGH